MELESITKEGSLWRVGYRRPDDCIIYSYYMKDKFRDELAVFNWWQEQTNGNTR